MFACPTCILAGRVSEKNDMHRHMTAMQMANDE
jgi:hypothetical protein